MTSQKRTVKVAIVGSGLAGLTSAYLLTRESYEDVKFDVHLFEKASTLGMDSSSISLPVPGKEKDWRVDVPMRSFQGGPYPQLMKLYKHLGVRFRRRDFNYSFSILDRRASARTTITTGMIYNGASGLKGMSMPTKMRPAKAEFWPVPEVLDRAWSFGLFLLSVVQIALCFAYVIYLSSPYFRIPGSESMSFAEWAEQSTPSTTWERLLGWRDFTQFVLVPLFSAVCTANEEDVKAYPVEELLDYNWLSFGSHDCFALNGVRDVVAKLVSCISTNNIHLSCPISLIHPDEKDPSLVTLESNGSTYNGFHHVIFATQAFHAVPLLATYASASSTHPQQREFLEEQIHVLRKFEYSQTIVINHTDEALLPDDPRDWRDLNLVHTSSSSADVKTKGKGSVSPRCLPSSYTMTTHVLPRPEGFPEHLPMVFQTTNPTVEPRKGRVLSVACLERALVTRESKRALKEFCVEGDGEGRWWKRQSTLGRLQGGRRGVPGVWVTGSYAYPGIPLLEGCVVSARMVIEQGIMRREGVRVKRSIW